MIRCVVLDDYQRVALTSADWTPIMDRVAVTLLDEPHTGERLVSALADAEIVVAMRERTAFPADLLDRLPRLRLLVTTGAANASIDETAARARGITVCGTHGSGTGTPELTWALILGLVRHLPAETTALRAGGWQHTVGVDLAGATLGVVGLGRIGSQVAHVGTAFGMRIVAWSPHLTPERAAEHGAEHVPSLGDLLARSDVATLHLPLADTTRGLLDAAALDRLRPTSFLVNTSRAGLLDQAALLQALRAGRIAGAGLDVFDEEPLPADHPYRTMPNVLATPHLGYVTADTYRVFYGDVVEDIAAYLAGAPVRIVVP